MAYFCPHCGTSLEEAWAESMGPEFHCPECDMLIRFEVLKGTPPSTGEPASLPDLALPEEETFSDTPPPGRIECRQIGSQLVILIRPGSNRAVRSLGCFAIVWLGFIGVLTLVFASQAPVLGGHLLLLFAFLGVFWLAGGVMLYFWLLGRFGKTYVLFEPDRVVIRGVLFGRERLRQYPLDGTTHVELVEAYRQNEQPVYKVSIITASGKPVSFGTFLSDEEKNWLVARINRHLGVPTPLKYKRRHR